MDAAHFPFQEALGRQRDQRQEGQQAGHGEGRREVVFVVEHLYVKRHGVGEAAYMAGDYRNGAELAHGARGAQNHAVEQAPFDVGQRDAEQHLPAAGAERQAGFLLVVPLALHHRDQLPRHEGKGHENGRQNDAGDREDDADVVSVEPAAKPSLRAEDQHVDQAGDDG